MLFYEDLVNEINKAEDIELKEKETFKLNSKKKIYNYSLSIPLILIATCNIYFVNNYKYKIPIIILSVALLYIAFKRIINVLSYSMVIDNQKKELSHGKKVVKLDNIQSCVLKRTLISNKLVEVLDIITNDNIQVIVPLFMKNKIRFVKIIKTILKESFSIEV